MQNCLNSLRILGLKYSNAKIRQIIIDITHYQTNLLSSVAAIQARNKIKFWSRTKSPHHSIITLRMIKSHHLSYILDHIVGLSLSRYSKCRRCCSQETFILISA